MAIKFASLKILARVTSVLPKKSCSLDLFESILFSFPSRRHEPPFFVLCHYSLQIYLKIFIKSIEIFATATKFELTRGFVQSNLWDSHAVVDVWELQYLYLTTKFSNPDRSLNRKRERFKVFEVKPRSNRNQTVMTS